MRRACRTFPGLCSRGGGPVARLRDRAGLCAHRAAARDALAAQNGPKRFHQRRRTALGDGAAYCYIEKLGSRDDVGLRSCRLIRDEDLQDGGGSARGFGTLQQLAAASQLGRAMAMSEEAVITDLDEAARQHMQQEAPRELDTARVSGKTFSFSLALPSGNVLKVPSRKMSY